MVIRPRRKTPVSHSTEEGGRKNDGSPVFLTEHGTHPLQSHRMSEAQVESLMLIYEAPSKEPQRRRLLVKIKVQ